MSTASTTITVQGTTVPVVCTYDIINRSSISNATIQNWIAAAQIQLNTDGAAAYGATLIITPQVVTSANPSHGSFTISGGSGQGTSGEHDIGSNGQPIGTLDAGSSFGSVIFTHEMMETMADPLINGTIWKTVEIGSKSYTVPYEACDPVEGDYYTITPPSGTAVQVTDFVWPSWFSSTVQSGGQYDQMKLCQRSGQILSSGYVATQSGQNLNGPLGGVAEGHCRATHRILTLRQTRGFPW